MKKTLDQAEIDFRKEAREHYRSRMTAIKTLWELYKRDSEASDPDIGSWPEYGLSFDYVSPGTFKGQTRGYFRYQISYGGPSEEIRFYTDERLKPHRIEFWFLDWFKGHRVSIQGRNKAMLEEIFDDFRECGTVEALLRDDDV